MTNFKAMSQDEQEMTLEQLAQGDIRPREERIAFEEAEAVEASLIAPTQGRDIHLAQDAWERGFLMLERV